MTEYVPKLTTLTDEMTAVAEQLLSLAEDLYGPRATTEWTFVGVEINDRPPYLAYYPDRGWVAISLSTKVLNNADQCLFQLAHEVGHLLYPTADRRTSTLPPTITLNEGVSTHFSLIALQTFRGEEAYRNAYESLRLYSPNYFAALNLVNRFIQFDPSAVQKLRAVQPMLNDAVEDDFNAAGLDVDPELWAALVAVF